MAPQRGPRSNVTRLRRAALVADHQLIFQRAAARSAAAAAASTAPQPPSSSCTGWLSVCHTCTGACLGRCCGLCGLPLLPTTPMPPWLSVLLLPWLLLPSSTAGSAGLTRCGTAASRGPCWRCACAALPTTAAPVVVVVVGATAAAQAAAASPSSAACTLLVTLDLASGEAGQAAADGIGEPAVGCTAGWPEILGCTAGWPEHPVSAAAAVSYEVPRMSAAKAAARAALLLGAAAALFAACLAPSRDVAVCFNAASLLC